MTFRPTSWAKRYPLLAFFVLTYAITWGFLPFGSFGAYGPLAAAIVVLSLTRGRAGLRELGSRIRAGRRDAPSPWRSAKIPASPCS